MAWSNTHCVAQRKSLWVARCHRTTQSLSSSTLPTCKHTANGEVSNTRIPVYRCHTTPCKTRRFDVQKEGVPMDQSPLTGAGPLDCNLPETVSGARFCCRCCCGSDLIPAGACYDGSNGRRKRGRYCTFLHCTSAEAKRIPGHICWSCLEGLCLRRNQRRLTHCTAEDLKRITGNEGGGKVPRPSPTRKGCLRQSSGRRSTGRLGWQPASAWAWRSS